MPEKKPFLILKIREMIEKLRPFKPSKKKISMVSLSQRTLKEQVVDKLLLLYLLNKHKISGLVKLQKTVFFAEDSMANQKIKGFNYFFFRWHLGEFSEQLEGDIRKLMRSNLITKTNNIETTYDGKQLLERLSGVLAKNEEILRRIDSVGTWASSKPLDTVKTMAYTRITRNGKQVKDIPEKTPLLNKIDESESKIKFEIENGWVETLEVMLDGKFYDSLQKALEMPADIPLEV